MENTHTQNGLLLSNRSTKILNILVKELSSFKSLYALNTTHRDIRLQATFDPRLVTILDNRKFKAKVGGTGYLNMTKSVAGLDIIFTFTD